MYLTYGYALINIAILRCETDRCLPWFRIPQKPMFRWESNLVFQGDLNLIQNRTWQLEQSRSSSFYTILTLQLAFATTKHRDKATNVHRNQQNRKFLLSNERHTRVRRLKSIQAVTLGSAILALDQPVNVILRPSKKRLGFETLFEVHCRSSWNGFPRYDSKPYLR